MIPIVRLYFFIFIPISDFSLLKPDEDKEEKIILMKSRALRSLNFIKIILSSSSLFLVGGPAVTTMIYLVNLINIIRIPKKNPRYSAPSTYDIGFN